MNQNQIKDIMFYILSKEESEITDRDIELLLEHLTYEMLFDYQKMSGNAVLIEGFNCEREETPEVINVSALELFNVMKIISE